MPQYVPGFEPIEQAPTTSQTYAPGFEPVATADEALGLPTLGEIPGNINAGLKAAREWFQPAANNLVRAPGEILTGQRPVVTGLQAPAEYQTPPESAPGRFAAEVLNAVPENMTSAGAQLGTLGLSRYGPLLRVLGAAGGAGLGSAASGNDLGTVAKDAGLYGAVTGGLEGASAGVSKLIRSLPWIKGLLNEGVASGTADVAQTVNPALGPAIETARGGIAPTLKGGRTAAALQETALGQGGKQALGGAFEQGMLDTTLAAGGQGVQSRALQTAWDLLPTGNPLADRLKNALAPSPNGTFSPQQAERLLAELGDAAFKGEAASPIARGIGGLELRKLYGQAVNETTAGLPAPAGDILSGTRRAFAGGNALMEGLREPQAFQGLPNRIMLNTPALGQYLSTNRAELESKLGPDGYRALANAILAGGQVGTRDILAPGSGSPLAALAQVYGRGQGGAPQIIGSVLRTGLPNLGSEYTGRAPFTLNPQIQALMDYLGLRGMEQARTGAPPPAYAGPAIPIGPTYGR